MAVDAKELAQEVSAGLTSPDYSEVFAEENKILQNLKKLFLMVAGRAVQKFGAKFEEEQQLLLASADILIEIHKAESSLLLTEKNAKRFGEDTQKEQIAMCKLYLYHAVDKVNEKAKEGIISFAQGDEQRMMLMGLKRFTKYQNQPNVVELRNIIAEKLTSENKYVF